MKKSIWSFFFKDVKFKPATGKDTFKRKTHCIKVVVFHWGNSWWSPGVGDWCLSSGRLCVRGGQKEQLFLHGKAIAVMVVLRERFSDCAVRDWREPDLGCAVAVLFGRNEKGRME